MFATKNNETNNNTAATFLGVNEVESWEDLVIPEIKTEITKTKSIKRNRPLPNKKWNIVNSRPTKMMKTDESDRSDKSFHKYNPPQLNPEILADKPSRPVIPKITIEKKVFINTTLILKGLPYSDTHIDQLLDIFEQYGKINLINVLRNEDKTCKGIAFIRFSKKEESDGALDNLSEFYYNGRNIKVEYARDNRI